MNIVAINTATGKVFESQGYSNDTEIAKIQANIESDAQAAGLTINIEFMSDINLNALMSQ